MQNTPLGRMLLHGVLAQGLQAEVQALQRTASIISALYSQKLTAVKQPESEQYLLGADAITLIKSPSVPKMIGKCCWAHVFCCAH